MSMAFVVVVSVTILGLTLFEMLSVYSVVRAMIMVVSISSHISHMSNICIASNQCFS